MTVNPLTPNIIHRFTRWEPRCKTLICKITSFGPKNTHRHNVISLTLSFVLIYSNRRELAILVSISLWSELCLTLLRSSRGSPLQGESLQFSLF